MAGPDRGKPDRRRRLNLREAALMASYELERPDWAIAPEDAAGRCGDFLHEQLTAAGKERVVGGLSGGIDSAVAAGLAVRTLGADKVRAVLMPYATSSEASRTDAAAVAENLGLRTETVDITPAADALLRMTAGTGQPGNDQTTGQVRPLVSHALRDPLQLRSDVRSPRRQRVFGPHCHLHDYRDNGLRLQ